MIAKTKLTYIDKLGFIQNLTVGQEVDESMWPSNIYRKLIEIGEIGEAMEVKQVQPEVKSLLSDEYMKLSNKAIKSKDTKKKKVK